MAEAIAPLFVADLATLKARLRLTAVVSSDTLAILNDVVEAARIEFYNCLGATRVAALKAITYSVNPTTDDGILRAKANACEVAMVRLQLLRRLPVLFMDGGAAQTQEAWNEEGLTRHAGQSELKSEIDRLESEIAVMLDQLAGEKEQDEGAINVQTVGPDETPPLPGSSINLWT